MLHGFLDKLILLNAIFNNFCRKFSLIFNIVNKSNDASFIEITKLLINYH